jgi:hypothetical protein
MLSDLKRWGEGNEANGQEKHHWSPQKLQVDAI